MAAQWKHMDPELYMAVTSNDVEAFKHLISHNVNLLKEMSPGRQSVLHIAAKDGHRDMVEEICRHHQSSSLFTKKDVLRRTPLHAAAMYGHTEVVGLLIELAKKVSSSEVGKTKADEMSESRDLSGQTALHWAIWNGHLGVAKELTQAYPNMLSIPANDGQAPLYMASWKGYLQIVKHILSVDVKRDESFHGGLHGRNPLHGAIMEGHQDVAETLLQAFPEYAKSTNDVAENPLHIAAERGMLSLVLKLLELNPLAVYQTNNWGNSPLHRAACFGNLRVFKEIIRVCPDSWFLINERRENVLHVAVITNQLDLVEYILKTPEFAQLLNGLDLDGNTPLHLAVNFDRIWIVFLLLEDKRITTRITNNWRMTPFDIISKKVEWGIPFSQKAAIWLAIRKTSKNYGIKEDRYAKLADISKETAKKWLETANTLLVVAALIGTVSFAAIFTLPGGYEDSGSEQGLAHFRKKTLFRIFLLFDALAMCSSLVAALLIIVANWTDTLGLRAMVPWALKMTSLSFLSMCAAFLWALGLMMKYNWALVVVSILNAVIACLVFSFFGVDSPVYFYWRLYAAFRRVKTLMTPCVESAKEAWPVFRFEEDIKIVR